MDTDASLPLDDPYVLVSAGGTLLGANRAFHDLAAAYQCPADPVSLFGPPFQALLQEAMTAGRARATLPVHRFGLIPHIYRALARRRAADGATGVLFVDVADEVVSRRELLEAERLRGVTETVGALNHEINNPLAAIVGNAQLMLRTGDGLGPESRVKLEAIADAARRIQQVTARMASLIQATSMPYAGEGSILDLRRSRTAGEPAEGGDAADPGADDGERQAG
jgi:signal transduction histidine kinase